MVTNYWNEIDFMWHASAIIVLSLGIYHQISQFNISLIDAHPFFSYFDMLGKKSIEFYVLIRRQKETQTQTDVLSNYRSVRIDR